MQLKFLFLLIGLQISAKVFGCECSYWTERFVDDLKDYEFVALVEVIGHDMEQNAQFDYIFTQVKIITIYSGKFEKDTLSIVDAKGFECFTSLRANKIGDKTIVKGFLKNRDEYEFSLDDKLNWVFLPENKGKKVLELGLCDENQLKVVDNIVVGKFSKKKTQEFTLQKISRIIRRRTS